MCMGMIDFAAAGQVTVVTPFTLAGAMAPVTLAGALTLQHAEALAGIALTQAVRPGAPVVYGAFTSNVDMKSGAPAFGTPEYFKAALASGQLARHVGLPYRSSAPNASNAVDAQAMYETMMSLFGAVLGGCNLLLHCAGWLEGGLTASKEKFILDIEVLQMLAESFQPIVVDADEIGLEAIAETSPGGHFFGGAHTLARYRTAFYEPLVSDWANFGQWTEEGSRDATQRANEIWKQILAEFEPPPIDDAIAAELDEFVSPAHCRGRRAARVLAVRPAPVRAGASIAVSQSAFGSVPISSERIATVTTPGSIAETRSAGTSRGRRPIPTRTESPWKMSSSSSLCTSSTVPRATPSSVITRQPRSIAYQETGSAVRSFSSIRFGITRGSPQANEPRRVIAQAATSTRVIRTSPARRPSHSSRGSQESHSCLPAARSTVSHDTTPRHHPPSPPERNDDGHRDQQTRHPQGRRRHRPGCPLRQSRPGIHG